MAKLDGQVVLITGASRGIGAGVARAVAARGALPVLVGLEPELLAALAGELGPGACWFEADVRDAAAVERAVAGTVARHGRIDALFANAGIGVFGMLATMDPDEFDRTLDINVRGVYRAVRACLPHLIASRGYLLINASVSAGVAPIGLGAYGTSKAAVEALGNCLRQELAYRDVDVGVAYFSWIATDLVAEGRAHPAFERMFQSLPAAMRAVSPLAVAVDAVVRGIENRRDRVIAPRSAALALALRWWLWRVGRRDARRQAPEIEKLCGADQGR